MNILERLEEHTFAVQYNPNCPKPYLVRLVGQGAGMLDLKAYGSKDIKGFGLTLEEAGEKALVEYARSRETFGKLLFGKSLSIGVSF